MLRGRLSLSPGAPPRRSSRAPAIRRGGAPRLPRGTAALLLLLLGGCKPGSSPGDASHVDFDLAHGVPVMPGARVVYGGTQANFFLLELAVPKSVADAARWYRDTLPKAGWHDLTVSEPSSSDTVRLTARRSAAWLHGRLSRGLSETEISIATGFGPRPSAEAILPEPSVDAAVEEPTSKPTKSPASAPSLGAMIRRLRLPQGVRRVGLPVDRGGAMMVGLLADGSPEPAAFRVMRALRAADWHVEHGEGPIPGSWELRGSHGTTALLITLVPGSGGSSGTLTLGSPSAVEQAGAAKKPKRGAGRGRGARRRPRK